jgi:hypothetical protein
MAEEFNLPGSSFEEVQKILKGYSLAADNANLDSLSKLTGLHPTIISRNNKFLSDIGLITGGMKKTTTDLGKRLGRALDHNQLEDSRRYWKEAVQTNEKVSGLVTTVRIKGGMSEKDFSDHVLYVSGQKNNSGNRTGARCVVDVLVAGELLEEKDGILSVVSPSSEPEIVTMTTSSFSQKSERPAPTSQIPIATKSSTQLTNQGSVLQVSINIQLHLPETENAEVYEKLFKALREQLLVPKD